MLDFFIKNFFEVWQQSASSMAVLWPFILFLTPIGLAILLWKMRAYYVRRLFIKKQKFVLLEIRLPQDVFKSPAAMELVLNALYQTGGEVNAYNYIWLGKSRPVFSLEIASIDGVVHFYVWTREPLKNLIEATIYSQYPNVEIYKIDDYTKDVFFDKSDFTLFGTEFISTKPDPYPIKTYKDYGMDKDPKEEYKIDPLSPLIEFFGSIGKGEQLWLQYVVQACAKDSKKEHDETAKKIINEQLARDAKTRLPTTVNAQGYPVMVQMSTGEKDVVEAIYRHLDKPLFQVGIRSLYIGKGKAFNPTNISGLLGIMKQFNSSNLNGLKLKNVTSFDDYPWSDIFKYRTPRARRRMLHAYKLRSFFHPPYDKYNHDKVTNVYSSEELATMFHLPSRTVSTPTLSRTNSRKVEAPANLPM